jgi:DHA3 family macrolide efflux protein-like MFS transporter
MIDVVSALFAVVPLFFIAVPEPDRSQGKELAGGKPSLWREMIAGFRYVLSWPGLLIVLLMATLLNFLLNPAFSLFPLLIKEHFGKGALELGYWEGLFGIGVIAGGLLLGIWGGFKRRILTTMVGLLGIGIGTASLGWIPSDGFTWAMVASIVLGVSQPITNGSLMGIVQARVAPDMQGRVFTLTGTLAGGMSPIGLIIAGPLADKFGVQTWYILGGAMCIVMAVSGLMIPVVMKIEENHNSGHSELGEGLGTEQAIVAK